MAQVAEHLLASLKLNSNPSDEKKQKRTNKNNILYLKEYDEAIKKKIFAVIYLVRICIKYI
jgi:hypothetical protein